MVPTHHTCDHTIPNHTVWFTYYAIPYFAATYRKPYYTILLLSLTIPNEAEVPTHAEFSTSSLFHFSSSSYFSPPFFHFFFPISSYFFLPGKSLLAGDLDKQCLCKNSQAIFPPKIWTFPFCGFMKSCNTICPKIS